MELIHHNGELKVLGRNEAMKMLISNTTPAPTMANEQPSALARVSHESNRRTNEVTSVRPVPASAIGGATAIR
jgi:hypothetical protein